jgi:hypothetical protein
MQEISPRSENLQELAVGEASQTSSRKNMEISSSISTTSISDGKEMAPAAVENSEIDNNSSNQKEIVSVGQDTQDKHNSSEIFKENEKKSARSIKIAPNNKLINDQDNADLLVTPTQANPGDLFNDENLLKRSSVLTQLNLVNQQNQDLSTKKQTLISGTSAVNDAPLMSPKIIELRHSEPFYNKSNSNEESVVKSTSSNTHDLSQPSPIISSSARRWKMASNYVIMTQSTLGFLPKGELDRGLLARLEQENSQLPPQVCYQFWLHELHELRMIH